MKAPRYFGAILDGWLATEHVMLADNTYVRETTYYYIKDVLFRLHTSRVILVSHKMTWCMSNHMS